MENLQESDEVKPVEFVHSTIRYLRSKGKNISVIAYSAEFPDFFKLYINNVAYGVWSAIGLASVLSQYRKKTYREQFLASYGLPAYL